MRKNIKRLIVGLIVILLLAGALIYKLGVWNKKIEPFWGQGISKFCINNLCLEKKDNDWMCSKDSVLVTANKEMVESYVKRLSELTLNEVVSDNKDNFQNFGIGDNNKTFMEIKGKKLEIGSISADFMGTYVRVENGDRVYWVPTVYEKRTLVTTDYWKEQAKPTP